MTEPDTRPGALPGGITRQVLERDGLRASLRARHPEVATLDDSQMRASIDATLAARPPEAGSIDAVWLFAYGSLLWNPCVAVAERRAARLYGFHRDFRIEVSHGRGSPGAPSLVLGLVPGGSCQGQALLVTAADLDHELLLVWRREMLTGIYAPRWARLHTDAGRRAAITFVANTRHPAYRGRLDEAQIVQMLATGTGVFGSAADYLANTVAHLDAQGIADRRLRRLNTRVAQRRGQHG